MPNATERVPTNGFRKAGLIPMPGRAGVFAQLVTEHQEASTLIRQLLASHEDDTKTRRNLWAEIGRALISHERAERQEIYKPLDGYPTLRWLVDEHEHQAHRLEAIVDELNATPIQTQVWRLTFQRLEATFKQHVMEEEGDFFARAQEAMGKDKAELLRIPYLTAKRTALRAL